jgi:MFS family permease
MSPPSPSGFDSLRIPSFRNYLFARTLTTVATEMQSVAIGWQVYQLTHSFSKLGFIGLAQFLPFVLLVLPAGQVADRHDRRLIINLCIVAELVGSAILLFFTHRGLHSLWPVYLVLSLIGSARAFAMPVAQAIVVNLVPEETFPSATAIGASSWQTATIIGPVLGGFLYLAGPQTVYSTVVLLLFIAALLMSVVRMPTRHVRDPEPFTWLHALEGLRFVRSRPVVLGAISLDLFAVLFGGCTAVLPAYASDVLHVGPQALGILRTAPGVGALLMAAALASFPIERHVGRWMFSGVAAFGISTIVFAVSHHFWLSLLMLFLLGSGDMISVYIRQILVQLETPDSVRGRVSAINSMFIGASAELGEFESGMMASAFGLIPSVIIGGCATLIVAATWSQIFPSLSRADRFPSSKT